MVSLGRFGVEKTLGVVRRTTTGKLRQQIHDNIFTFLRSSDKRGVSKSPLPPQPTGTLAGYIEFGGLKLSE